MHVHVCAYIYVCIYVYIHNVCIYLCVYIRRVCEYVVYMLRVKIKWQVFLRIAYCAIIMATRHSGSAKSKSRIRAVSINFLYSPYYFGPDDAYEARHSPTI